MSTFQTYIFILLSHKGSLDLELYSDKINNKIDFENEIKALNLSHLTLEILEQKIESIFDDITKLLNSEGETDIVEYEGSGDGFDYVITFTNGQRANLWRAKINTLLLLSVITDLRIDLELQKA